jgi:ribosome-binding factor A
MTGNNRNERVAGEIHAILAEALRTRIKDPRIGLISLTGVRVTRDLGTATVYFTPLGGEGDVKRMGEGLRAASGFLRREIGRQLRLRVSPELVFKPDTGVDEAVRLTALLERMEEEDAARTATADDAPSDAGDDA